MGFREVGEGLGRGEKGAVRGWSIGGDWEIEDSEERSGVWDWTG